MGQIVLKVEIRSFGGLQKIDYSIINSIRTYSLDNNILNQQISGTSPLIYIDKIIFLQITKVNIIHIYLCI